MSATKTKPQNLTIDELFGMGSGWLSDNESDPPACGDSGSHTSHSAHSPQCNTSSSLTSPSGSVSAVTGVAGRPGNIGSPDVLLSPPFYLTPPLGEEESDWDRDSGCQTFNTGLLPLNGQRQKNQGSLKKLNSLVNRELSSTSLAKYTVSIPHLHNHMHVNYIHDFLIIHEMLRKKGKATQQKDKATQHHSPKAVFFKEKSCLRWDSNP